MLSGPSIPALQCCLTCGRLLTDRELHDELEQQVLAVIRAEHPEWVDGEGNCAPCAEHYRRFLAQRASRVQSGKEHPQRLQWLRAILRRKVRSFQEPGLQ